jgi:GntR family transcriptional regulator, trigonelline degradation regulator
MNAALAGTNRINSIAAPLRKQVIELLREAIVSQEFEPGQRLLERDLCTRFGVSRTVVREALRHLEAEGFVNLVPNHGPVVASVSADEARDLYEVREALESLAAKSFAQRASPAERRQLARSLARIEAAYRRGSFVDDLAAKDEFYTVMFGGARNGMVASMLRTVHARVQMLRGFSVRTPGRMEKSLVELKALVNAIDRGDAEAASSITAEHVRNAAASALARLAELESTQR